MCTTILVLSTLAFLLRRRFFNKVEPISVWLLCNTSETEFRFYCPGGTQWQGSCGNLSPAHHTPTLNS
uniref:Secreted protein n=1 Tax=Podarcis muralis TaxID=64176 RepID=A0A670IJ81_PODMU